MAPTVVPSSCFQWFKLQIFFSRKVQIKFGLDIFVQNFTVIEKENVLFIYIYYNFYNSVHFIYIYVMYIYIHIYRVTGQGGEVCHAD